MKHKIKKFFEERIKNKINKKDFVLLFIGFLFGIFFVYKTTSKVDVRPLEEKIDQQEILIKKKEAIIDSLDLIETQLIETVIKINKEYADFRSSLITQKQTDSLQKEEIRKGISKYGEPTVRSSQAALASSYGNNAFDDLKITEHRLANNQKVNITLAEVVQHKDTIIINQNMIIKEVKKEATKGKITWFLGGSLFGGLLTLLLFLL